jgi:hypothetical protein
VRGPVGRKKQLEKGFQLRSDVTANFDPGASVFHRFLEEGKATTAPGDAWNEATEFPQKLLPLVTSGPVLEEHVFKVGESFVVPVLGDVQSFGVPTEVPAETLLFGVKGRIPLLELADGNGCFPVFIVILVVLAKNFVDIVQ